MNRYKLYVLIFIVVITHIVWNLLDTRPPGWDESVHLSNAIGYYNALSEPSLKTFSKILTLSDFYPPFFEFITGLFFLITGPSVFSASLITLLFLVILMICLYNIGEELGGPTAGLLSALFFATYYQIISQSKVYMLDIPLATLVVVSVLILIKSDNLKKTWSTFALGVIAGIGMLTKWSFLFYFLIPSFIFIVINYKNCKKKNILLYFLMVFIVITPWYGIHFLSLVIHSLENIHRGVTEGDPGVFSFASLFYYFIALFHQTSIMAFVLIAASLIWLFKKWHSQNLIIKLWVFVPLVILTLIRNKDGRYIIPILPAFALLSASFLNSINFRFKKYFISTVSIIFIIYFFYLNFFINSPKKENWHIKDIISSVTTCFSKTDKKIILRVIPDHQYFNNLNFSLFTTTMKEHRVMIAGTTNFPQFTDAVVVKTGYQGPAFSNEYRKSIVENLMDEKHTLRKVFSVAKEFTLPDGSTAVLFTRKIKSTEFPAKKVVKLLKKKINKILSNYAKELYYPSIKISTLSDRETKKGHFKKISLEASSAILGDFSHKPYGIRAEGIKLSLEDIYINLYTLFSEESLQILKVGSVNIEQLFLPQGEVRSFINASVKDFFAEEVSFDNKVITITGTFKKPKIKVKLACTLKAVKNNLRLEIKKFKIGYVTIPSVIANFLIPYGKPLFNLKGFSGALNFGIFIIDDGEIIIVK